MSRRNTAPTTVLTLDKLVALTKALKQSQTSKPIEFIEVLTSAASIGRVYPHQWDNLVLLGPAWSQKQYDLILAWDNDKVSGKVVYLGHWNDGVVE